ncbi:MAG: C40 family peptidase [Clostridia bacterium]|nr:C40 family peptidase [Clostridia bacterium]
MNTNDKKNNEYVYVLIKAVLCIFTALAFIAISVFGITVYEVGNDEIIRLQAPSKSFTVVDLHAVEQQAEKENQSVSPINLFFKSATDMKSKHVNDTYDNLVFMLTEEQTNDYNEDVEIVDFIPDGSNYWMSDDSSLQLLPSQDSERIEDLEIGSEVLRVSFGSNWSYIMTEEGEYGFVLSSLLVDEKPEPTPTPEPTSTPAPTATPVPTSTPVPTVIPVDETASSEIPEDTAAESTQTEDSADSEASDIAETVETTTVETVPTVSEEACDLYLYASCELNVRSGPDISYTLVSVLHFGTPIHAVALTENGWYHLDDGGYVKASLTVSEIAVEEETTNESGITVSNDFGNYCLSFVGTAYVYGGASPSGFDCSGFVSYVMANYYGITLPHCAADIAEMGTAVSGDDIQPGDVLCHDYDADGYIEHVSMYIGDGLCVHASNSQSGVIIADYPMGSVVTIRRFI